MISLCHQGWRPLLENKVRNGISSDLTAHDVGSWEVWFLTKAESDILPPISDKEESI